MFGPKCSLFAENHVFSDCETDIKTQGVSRRGIEIGDNCWIGSNVVILDGVRIGGGALSGQARSSRRTFRRIPCSSTKGQKALEAALHWGDD